MYPFDFFAVKRKHTHTHTMQYAHIIHIIHITHSIITYYFLLFFQFFPLNSSHTYILLKAYQIETDGKKEEKNAYNVYDIVIEEQ